MPVLVKFMLRHALIGGAVAILFVAVLLAFDLGGLATLIRTSRFGLLAVALLTFFTALTFGSLQMGIAVMSMKEERDLNDGQRSGDEAKGHREPQPAFVAQRKRR